MTALLNNLVGWTVDLGLVLIAVGIILCIYRLLRGPHLADRALAVDTIGVHLIGLVLLLSMRLDSLLLMDGALILSLLSFAGTVAVAVYIARPHVVRRRTSQAAADPDD